MPGFGFSVVLKLLNRDSVNRDLFCASSHFSPCSRSRFFRQTKPYLALCIREPNPDAENGLFLSRFVEDDAGIPGVFQGGRNGISAKRTVFGVRVRFSYAYVCLRIVNLYSLNPSHFPFRFRDCSIADSRRVFLILNAFRCQFFLISMHLPPRCS